MKELSHKIVWDALSKVNVNEHVVTKGSKGGFQAKYLSWSWAWETLMHNFPQARFEFKEYEKADGTLSDVLTYDDGTCQVECTMWIGELNRTMWLSVMDNMFNAIPNPSSSQINTAKMRCLTKLIAFWGLGFYIYAGEDLPPVEEETKEPVEPIKKSKARKAIKQAKGQGSSPKKPVVKRVTNGVDSSVRLKALIYIETNKGHDVFDDDNKAAIQSFLTKIDDNIEDDVITTWMERMEKVINNYTNQGA